MAAGFFPLDKELQVPDGHLLPHVQQALVRLGSELPFGRAAQHVEEILGVQVHGATARRHTLAAGQRSLEVQTEQAKPLAACPEEPAAERLAMSSDGAMVRLVGVVWAEVKLVAIGTVERRQPKQGGEEETVTTHLSYFARMTDATTFADQASAEVRRRGVERATEVCALQDGAEWIPGFVRSHRSDALCILDFAHAAKYVHQIGEQVRVARGHLPVTWEAGVLHRLKHDGPARVLDHLSWLARRFPQVQGDVTYLLKRREQMDYPTYRAAGWPIGSGSVESGHKLVMQARLKGPGMHWKPEHVNPMLALRGALLNDRWQENWTAQVGWRLRQQLLRRRTHQQQQFHQQQAARQATQPLEPAASTGSVGPPQKTGRTEAQYRWGRYTISHRRLQQAGGAK